MYITDRWRHGTFTEKETLLNFAMLMSEKKSNIDNQNEKEAHIRKEVNEKENMAEIIIPHERTDTK